MGDSAIHICDFHCFVCAKELNMWSGHHQNCIPCIKYILVLYVITRCLKIPMQSNSLWFSKQLQNIDKKFSVWISGRIQTSLPFKKPSCLRYSRLDDRGLSLMSYLQAGFNTEIFIKNVFVHHLRWIPFHLSLRSRPNSYKINSASGLWLCL